MSSMIRNLTKHRKKESKNVTFHEMLEKAKKDSLLHNIILEVKRNYEDIIRLDNFLHIINVDLYGDPENEQTPGKLELYEKRLQKIEKKLKMKKVYMPQSPIGELQRTVLEESLDASNIFTKSQSSFDGLPTSELCQIIRGMIQDKLGYLMESHVRQHEELKKQVDHLVVGPSNPSQNHIPGNGNKKKKRKKKRKKKSNEENLSSSDYSMTTTSLSSTPNSSQDSSFDTTSKTDVDVNTAWYRKKQKKEIAYNVRNRNKIILKFDEPITGNTTPMEIVKTKLHELDPLANMYVVCQWIVYAKWNSNDQSSILIHINPTFRQQLCDFIVTNREREKTCRFVGFLHATTRAKKFLLGQISKKICENQPKGACTPRFTTKSMMVVIPPEGENNHKEWLKYDTVIQNPKYKKYLTEEDIENALKLCNDRASLLLQ